MTNGADLITARPSKSFFVDMITRDLTIADCILDLIDNAVGKAVETSQVNVMQMLTDDEHTAHLQGVSVLLKMSETQFLIEDTCGGISIDEAKNQVFLFGNPDEGKPSETGQAAGLSVYGIGMKRAFFKLGNKIRMNSTTAHDCFQVDIDVENWKKTGDEDWTFKFTSTGAPKKGVPSGTVILITELREGVRDRFAQTSFMNDLRNKVAATYSLFIEAGLQIKINDVAVQSALPHLGRDARMIPARTMIKKDNVDILIIAGVTAKEDTTEGGWYIFCNGRMVLEGDRTAVTGWGTDLPKWHIKFRHFVGCAYFLSRDVRVLPWMTTKRGIVFESPIYQTALAEMQVQSRPVLTFLNNLYPGDVDAEGIAEREVFQGIKSVSIDKLSHTETRFRPDLQDLKAKAQYELVNIQYKKKKKDVDHIKSCYSALKSASAKRIGEYTFDYFMKQECGQ